MNDLIHFGSVVVRLRAGLSIWERWGEGALRAAELLRHRPRLLTRRAPFLSTLTRDWRSSKEEFVMPSFVRPKLSLLFLPRTRLLAPLLRPTRTFATRSTVMSAKAYAFPASRSESPNSHSRPLSGCAAPYKLTSRTTRSSSSPSELPCLPRSTAPC